jgi:DNA polymerase-3 subunit gamma/tau
LAHTVSNSTQYISFARKYRPKSFADLIGQEVLTKVLQYSIQKDQIVNSFLFTGIRGIGKTTSARIVAQTINCTDKQISGDMIAPCQKCANCTAFNQQSHPDSVEIDAASYTSVDNIRDVIEKAIYKPVLGRYKIFIIDEVHMLSKSAFNALLKTLEEPPSHVIFMLLTTEINKVPLTILSRCQKFNLKRFGISDLVLMLGNICKDQAIEFENAALESIAYKADGSARDATVLLEQASFLAKQKNSPLNIEIVRESLDLNNFKHAIDFLNLILKQQTSQAFNLTGELYKENFDFLSIISAIVELIALLSKLKLVPNYNLGYFNAYKAEVHNLLDITDLGFLTSLWQILNKGLQEVSSAPNQLIAFEMLIIKAMYCALIPSPSQLTQTTDNNSSPHNTESEVKKKVEITDREYKTIEPALKQVKPSAKTIEHTAKPANPKQDDEKIFEFISYIHKNHLFGLYHFIMNECEVTAFENSTIKLAGEKLEEENKRQLSNALKEWTGEDWKITFATKENFHSLQSYLKIQAEKNESVKMISSFFPETQISDVWFNFIVK